MLKGGIGRTNDCAARITRTSTRRKVASPIIWWTALFGGSLFLPPIPLSFTPTAHSKLLVGGPVAAGYLLWRVLFSRKSFPDISTPTRFIPIAIAFYMFLHAVYAAFSGNDIGALIEAQWLMYFLAPVLMMSELEVMDKQRIIKMMLACLAIESVLAVVSSFTGPMYGYVVLWYGPRFGTNVYRAVGTTDSTNSLGGLMAFGALVCFLAPDKTLPLKRVTLLAGLLTAVVLSQSKSAFFALLISLTVVRIATLPWCLARTRELVKTLISQTVVLLMSALVFYFYGDAVLDNMTRDYGDRAALGQRVISEIERFDWHQTAFGVGFHGVDYIEPTTGVWITAHNSYINLVADLGLCGATLVALLLSSLLVVLLRDRQWHLLAGLVGLLLHFFTEAFLYAPMFIMTIGTLYGISCLPHQRRPSRMLLSYDRDEDFGLPFSSQVLRP